VIVRQLLAALAVLAAVPARAEMGGLYLNMPLSVRQMGMGNASLGGGDCLGAWSNPALLAGRASRGEVALGGGSLFGGLESAFGAGAAWQLTPRFTVGLHVSSYSMSFGQTDAWGDAKGESVERNHVAVGPAVAVAGRWWRAGVAVRIVNDIVAGNSANATAADAGILVDVGPATVGLALRSMGPDLRAAGAAASEAEQLPGQLRVGAAWRLAGLGVTLAGEYAQAGVDKGSGVGVEWQAAKMLAVRAGAAGIGSPQGVSPTAGLSFAYRNAGLDYALNSHALGLTHRVSVSYAFAGPAEPLPAVAAAETTPEVPAEVANAPAQEAAPVPAAPPPKPSKGNKLPNVAVADLSPQNVSSGDAAVIAEMVRVELVRSGKANVVEKANMDKILAEQGFQQTGCTSEECAVKLGKLLNVQRMVVGSFGKLMDSYFLAIRVVDIETGRVLYADRASGKTVEALQDAVVSLTNRVAKSLR
jgi:hypothetical protein